MKNTIQMAASVLWPELYDDQSKGAFERASTMTVEAARARAEAEKRVKRMFDHIASPHGEDALKDSRHIMERFDARELSIFMQVCAALGASN